MIITCIGSFSAKKKISEKKILYTVANVLELGMAEVARSLRWK